MHRLVLTENYFLPSFHGVQVSRWWVARQLSVKTLQLLTSLNFGAVKFLSMGLQKLLLKIRI